MHQSGTLLLLATDVCLLNKLEASRELLPDFVLMTFQDNPVLLRCKQHALDLANYTHFQIKKNER